MLDIHLTCEIWGSDSCTAIGCDAVLRRQQSDKFFLTCLTLQMLTLWSLEASGLGDPVSLCHIPEHVYPPQRTCNKVQLPLTATAAYCSYTLILTWRCENVSSRGGTVTSRVPDFIVCLRYLHMEICSSRSKKNSNTLFKMMTSAEMTTSGLSAIFASTISIRSCGRSTMSDWSAKRKGNKHIAVQMPQTFY